MIWTEQLLTAGQNLPMPFQRFIRVHLIFKYTGRRVAYPKGWNADTPTKWVLLSIKRSGSWLGACGVNVINRSVFNLCRLCLCRITPRILSSRRLIEITKVSRCQSWVRMSRKYRFGAWNRISELYVPSCSLIANQNAAAGSCEERQNLRKERGASQVVQIENHVLEKYQCSWTALLVRHCEYELDHVYNSTEYGV